MYLLVYSRIIRNYKFWYEKKTIFQIQARFKRDETILKLQLKHIMFLYRVLIFFFFENK